MQRRLLAGAILIALAGVGQAATITYEFSGALTTVYADATAANSPAPNTLLGGIYSGSLTYDSTTGGIIVGELSFDSGYGTNNFGSLAPEYAQSQWLWSATTYNLSGTIVTTGSIAHLLIGADLDPTIHNASSAEVQAMGTSNLIPALSGALPVCTAFLPSSQEFACSAAPPAEVFGLDSLSLVIDLSGGAAPSHNLKFDEIIGHCQHACSTSWYQFSGSGSGSISVVPIPAAAWLFGSALLGLGWTRRQS